MDLVDAELRALARVHSLRGRVLTLAAPWPLIGVDALSATSAVQAAAELHLQRPGAAAHFAAHGWALPDMISRVYDSTVAQHALDWQPHVTFDTLLHTLAAADYCEANSSCKPPSPPPCTGLGGVGSKQQPIFLTLDLVLRGAY